MKKQIQLLSLLSIFLLSSTLIVAQEKKENDFVPLFNGKNLEGWYLKIKSGDAELAKEVFAVDTVDANIHVFKDFPDKYEFNTGENSTHGMMYTNKTYSRYIFKFEYKWGSARVNNFNKYQYDAGMYYHVNDDKIWPLGIEYQVRYNHFMKQNHTGDFWANNITWYTVDGETYTDPVRGGKPNKTKKGEHKAHMYSRYNALNGKWNKCEIIVMGNKYAIHKLNGRIVNLATNLPFSAGKIGLQSETAEIFYRNIEIKELKKDLPKEHFYY